MNQIYDDMAKVFLLYGATKKRADNSQTGGFGMASFIWFASLDEKFELNVNE